MGEELQKAGINTPASKKSSETFRRSTKGSPFEDETNSQPAFGNPKFYQDPEEEEQILLFAIILILVIPGGWKWAGDVLGEKLGNGWRERGDGWGSFHTQVLPPISVRSPDF